LAQVLFWPRSEECVVRGDILRFAMGDYWATVVAVWRCVTFLSYPAGLVFVFFSHLRPTKENARIFWLTLLAVWLPVSSIFYYKLYTATWSLTFKVFIWFVWAVAWDSALCAFCFCAYFTECLYRRPKCGNRLFNKLEGEKPKFLGPKICVLGNGPSLSQGQPCGAMIDGMDEVVRFNNFQTKVSGLEAWTGSKTTVHFSDSMLYPSYPEYKVPNACVCLSLFMDRLVVSGSYFLFRCFIDLAPRQALAMMFDEDLGFLSHDDIMNMKKTLGNQENKHPTSGILAIDWFVRNRPDPNVPVHIHGFDFFQGPQIHYYSKTEPLYERLNDLIGVNVMHEPSKERAFVEALVREGKVKWLSPKQAEESHHKACMAEAEKQKRQIKRGGSGIVWNWIVTVNRILTVLTYPIAAPFIAGSHAPAKPEHARFLWQVLATGWVIGSGSFYTYMFFFSVGMYWQKKCLVHFLWFWAIDVALLWSVTGLVCTEYIYKRPKCTNRLFGDEKPAFNGSKIVVLGNGPSLARGTPTGHLIDSMDEVVRFNNFQAKGPLEAWTGTKTTVHFSDSMLYPSYPEYKVPGACIVLSLFMDRMIVSMSYFVFRMGIDLAPFSAWEMMSSPALGWVPADDIQNLKKKLGINARKHPTSGILAIDWFVRHRPDPKVPLYIHGFDFFQGPTIHYYSKSEPLYERLNDLLGVTVMHEPQKEKAFVEELVKEGKVVWLNKLEDKSK